VVSRHGRDLASKTIKSIIVQCEMTVDEFVATVAALSPGSSRLSNFETGS
jgi:hypothetical protein